MQQGEVSSSNPNILSNDQVGPILLEVRIDRRTLRREYINFDRCITLDGFNRTRSCVVDVVFFSRLKYLREEEEEEDKNHRVSVNNPERCLDPISINYLQEVVKRRTAWPRKEIVQAILVCVPYADIKKNIVRKTINSFLRKVSTSCFPFRPTTLFSFYFYSFIFNDYLPPRLTAYLYLFLPSLFLQALDGFLFVLNSEGRVEYVTDNITQYINYTKDDVLGKDIYNIIHHGDHNIFMPTLLPVSLGRYI